jgi:N,N-dimethylformamidase
MRLTGYSDRLSVAPGETIEFKVSSAHATYRADIVRLIHGDPNPAGPGLITEEVRTTVSGTYPGRRQEIVTGSCIVVPNHPALQGLQSFTLQAWIQPTTPEKERQGLISRWSSIAPAGFALMIERGTLTLWLAGAERVTSI